MMRDREEGERTMAFFGGTNGNDTFDGGGDDDFIRGRQGNDTLTGGGGEDTLIGNQGNDDLRGNGGDDDISGGQGRDFLRGDNGNDTLVGGNDQDTLRGGNNDDDLSGGNGDDELDGNAGNDTLDGGRGDDTLDDTGGDDNNLFVYSGSQAGEDVITGNYDVNEGGTEGTFDTTAINHDGWNVLLVTDTDFYDFIYDIEHDGIGSTDAVIDGDDLVFYFNNPEDIGEDNEEDEGVNSLRYEDIFAGELDAGTAAANGADIA